jgi:hypothetical protein
MKEEIMARQTMKGWIIETLNDLERDGKCTRIVLSHLVAQGRVEIHTQKFAPTASYLPESLAELFTGKADVHCQDIKGLSRFVLDAYWKSNERESSFPFQREGQVDHASLYAHEATSEGRKAELENGLIGLMFKQINKVNDLMMQNMEMMQRERGQFYDHRVNMLRENNLYYENVKELAARVSIDTHNRDMEKLQMQRKLELEKQVMKAIPVVTNMVTGREVFPQSTVDTEIIESIAESMTPEYLQVLSLIDMPEEKKGVLMHRLNQAMEKRMAQQQYAKQLPQTSLSGEEELAGKEPH